MNFPLSYPTGSALRSWVRLIVCFRSASRVSAQLNPLRRTLGVEIMENGLARQHRLPQDERAVRTKASLYNKALSSLAPSRAASD